MTSTPNNTPQFSQTYFLNQGKSIQRLHHILSSTVFIYQLKKWSSILLEISLYLFFASALIFILWPVDFSAEVRLSHEESLELAYHNSSAHLQLIYFKLALFLALIPVLLLAVILGRNRKKNHLIREAFEEVKKMKEGFEEVLREG